MAKCTFMLAHIQDCHVKSLLKTLHYKGDRAHASQARPALFESVVRQGFQQENRHKQECLCHVYGKLVALRQCCPSSFQFTTRSRPSFRCTTGSHPCWSRYKSLTRSLLWTTHPPTAASIFSRTWWRPIRD